LSIVVWHSQVRTYDSRLARRSSVTPIRPARALNPRREKRARDNDRATTAMPTTTRIATRMAPVAAVVDPMTMGIPWPRRGPDDFCVLVLGDYCGRDIVCVVALVSFYRFATSCIWTNRSRPASSCGALYAIHTSANDAAIAVWSASTPWLVTQGGSGHDDGRPAGLSTIGVKRFRDGALSSIVKAWVDRATNCKMQRHLSLSPRGPTRLRFFGRLCARNYRWFDVDDDNEGEDECKWQLVGNHNE
jgi:hypothetical protein